jgi:hypothetical protein
MREKIKMFEFTCFIRNGIGYSVRFPERGLECALQ